IPKLATRSITDISTTEVSRIVDGLSDTPGTASHLFAAARLFFRWAAKRRLIDRSPLDGVDGPAISEARERVLNPDELASVYRRAISQRFMGGKIVQFLLLTGQRRGEAGALRGEWIDRTARTITLPREITKNGLAHTFPYGKLVAELL